MQRTKLFGIVGNPLGHSQSPELHTEAFRAIGYPGVYLAFPQKRDALPAFFQAVRNLPLQGGNITIPFKEEAARLVDQLSPLARKIGAINTFFWKDGLLCGENTDVLGFMASLEGQQFHRALVLGAGGAARAIVVGLQELAVPEIYITNRTEERAQNLASEFSLKTIPFSERGCLDCDLLVNTTSLGMTGTQEEETPYPASAFRKEAGFAYDIIYTPQETRFLREAASQGWRTKNGAEMFIEQARAAFFLWTKQEMPRF